MFESFLGDFSRLINPESPFVYLIVFAGGLLSSFLPCSLSSLPLVISYVSAGKRDTKSSFRLSLVFALGLTLTFTFLSVLALALGELIGNAGRLWYLILALLMLLMGLQMLGIFTFIPASYLQTRNTRRGYMGALLSGILSGVFSSPCSTPVLVAILSVASMSGSLVFATMLLLCYSAGYSILSIAAGTFVGFVSKLSESSSYRKLSRIIEIILGSAILVLAFYLFYQAF